MTFKHKFKKKHNRNGATIRANATIVCGYTIGKYAFIGAGAVVTMDVPDHALALGSPAEVAGWMCECGHRIQFQGGGAICNECGKQYKQIPKGVTYLQDESGTQEAVGGA